jgi:hypothetical protein
MQAQCNIFIGGVCQKEAAKLFPTARHILQERKKKGTRSGALCTAVKKHDGRPAGGEAVLKRA